MSLRPEAAQGGPDPASPAAPALRGRRALVAGASGGIGLAICRALARAGAQLFLVARRAGPLREAAAAVGGEAWVGDVTEAAAVDRLRARLEESGGPPDLVVNAAGAFELAPLAETSVAMFDRLVAANLRAPFLLVRAFLPGMLARGSGHLVTVGSIAGRTAFPDNGAYCATKFGVRGLHAVLDLELKGSGVRATLIEPAATSTPLWDAQERSGRAGLPPRSAMLPPEAVAQAVLYAVTCPPEVAVRSLLLERT